MNFRQQIAGFHALWKNLSTETVQAGTFDQIANFKIEAVV
jgi:hypothetical protein